MAAKASNRTKKPARQSVARAGIFLETVLFRDSSFWRQFFLETVLFRDSSSWRQFFLMTVLFRDSSFQGPAAGLECRLYTAGSFAYIVLRIAASTGRPIITTAAILIRLPGRKGITHAVREASSVIPVTNMNHAVPMT